jgi:hypothetical protein
MISSIKGLLKELSINTLTENHCALKSKPLKNKLLEEFSAIARLEKDIEQKKKSISILEKIESEMEQPLNIIPESLDSKKTQNLNIDLNIIKETFFCNI